MTFAYLPDHVLDDVRDAAVSAGFVTEKRLDDLAAGIAPAFVGMYLDGGSPQGKLLTFTARLNSTRVLLSGEVPLQRWLKNAALMSQGLPEELVFRRALEMASVDGAASPTAAPGDLAAAPPDVTALPAHDGELEIVINEDDTLEVDYLLAGAEASRSVAKLMVRRYFNGIASTLSGNQPDVAHGTGWMIAPSLLITNWHVVNARVSGKEPPASEVDFERQGEEITAIFDFYRTGAAVHNAKSAGCVAFDRELDYAILRLDTAVSPRAPLRLRTAPILKDQKTALATRVNVLQHPGGNPMRLGFRNNFVVSGEPDRLSYLTDTAGGSSGSPICDDAWFAAALHRGWRTIPGDPVSVWGREVRQENYGTPVGAILGHLATNHPTLHAEVTAGQQERQP
jgi:endonuclease G, mitochondrial